MKRIGNEEWWNPLLSAEVSNPIYIYIYIYIYNSFYCIIVKIKYIHILPKQDVPSITQQDVPSITRKFRTFSMFVIM
jgi:hypothetical protein